MVPRLISYEPTKCVININTIKSTIMIKMITIFREKLIFRVVCKYNLFELWMKDLKASFLFTTVLLWSSMSLRIPLNQHNK